MADGELKCDTPVQQVTITNSVERNIMISKGILAISAAGRYKVRVRLEGNEKRILYICGKGTNSKTLP